MVRNISGLASGCEESDYNLESTCRAGAVGSKYDADEGKVVYTLRISDRKSWAGGEGTVSLHNNLVQPPPPTPRTA
jgi:hypothetical protein